MPGLGARLGRGGATTFLQDLRNSDCVLIIGANMAENHPVGFRFVVEAKERGATIIHVDPRFTRTSALADIHVPLRVGSDIAFLGGLINYVLTNELWFHEYVRHYTNAAAIVREDFQDTEDLDGLFSGYDEATRTYDRSTWQLERDDSGRPLLDPTLAHPRCVLRVLQRHFQRYTPEFVADVCGVPNQLFEQVAAAIANNSGRERTTSIAYSVAWTQHTTGTQLIGCGAILQLLLGNIGRPGGGIMALRGHATIQGSTDIPTLFNLLPGYLPMPSTLRNHDQIEGYLADAIAPGGGWSLAPAYFVSLLKAWYGENTNDGNGAGFDLLPRISGDYSFQALLPMMQDNVIRGLFCMGQNPAVGGQNGRLARNALASLDWLVVRDLFEIETAAFWYDAPEVCSGETSAGQIGTEVFLLPAAVTAEKDGSYTNTQRLIQWHDRAIDPPGEARSEAWFLHELRTRLLAFEQIGDQRNALQLNSLTWDYPLVGIHQEPDAEAVMAEINGYTVADRVPVAGYDELKDDGSTACGCWIYSGVMPAVGQNLAKSRAGDGLAALGWGYAWPANRRMLYNRASADAEGKPWSERKAWVWWDESISSWTGYDEPDFPRDKSPSYLPPTGATGIAAHSGDSPFIMMHDGKGQLFAAAGLVDGPLPVHYEPWESPVVSALHAEVTRNPVAVMHDRPDNPYHHIADERFPYVMTTVRLTEHHTAGGMSRFVPWLVELQPEGFAELDPELARLHGVKTGDQIVISTARGEMVTRALVTSRIQPLKVGERQIHQIGVPWHFGYSGIATGSIANDLSALIADPNSLIHEAKAFTCNLRKGEANEK